jgi:hypothetical protein
MYEMMHLIKRESLLGIIPFFVLLIFSGLAVYLTYDVPVVDSIYVSMIGYALQHFASSAYLFLSYFFMGNVPKDIWVDSLFSPLYIFVYVVSYLGLYILFIRRLPTDGEYKSDFGGTAQLFLLVVPIALVLSIIEKKVCTEMKQLVVTQVYAMAACFLVLWIQYWQKKVVTMEIEMRLQERVMAERRKQFDQSVSNIDLINRKCHDLKYQIQALKSDSMSDSKKEAIDNVTESVNFYDDFFRTGNEILDTILMEKSTVCRRYGISFSAMMDGKALNFMNPMDLYIMMGNAFDNAIEATRQLRNAKERVISSGLSMKDNLVILRLENTFSGKIRLDKNGNLLTSKDDKDYHGFGVESIRRLVMQYGGSMTFRADGDIFTLSIVFAR